MTTITDPEAMPSGNGRTVPGERDDSAALEGGCVVRR